MSRRPQGARRPSCSEASSAQSAAACQGTRRTTSPSARRSTRGVRRISVHSSARAGRWLSRNPLCQWAVTTEPASRTSVYPSGAAGSVRTGVGRGHR
jgi:hypothetical protein